ncbi:MAG: methyltransferase domain-containing protein [Myxococcota bacterium]
MSREQYSRHGILRYEKMFGQDFVSTGGAELVQSLCADLSWAKGIRILDIGSGLGGPAFLFARLYDAKVVGVDLSTEMVEIAQERLQQRAESRVTFVAGDIAEVPLELSSFDWVWSRDCFLHIPDKRGVLARSLALLKPGGSLCVTDYACRAGALSEDFRAYVSNSGYHLLDVEAYGALCEEAGFEDVRAEDISARVVEHMRRELVMFEQQRASFVEDFSAEDLDYLIQRWRNKLAFCAEGSMVFVRIQGRKPE